MADNDSISDFEFMAKLLAVPRKAGCAVLRAALTLYVLLKDADIPIWAKVSIVAALTYFISPIDAILDFLPGGYVDDLANMALLLGQLEVFVDDDIIASVESMMPRYCQNKELSVID